MPVAAAGDGAGWDVLFLGVVLGLLAKLFPGPGAGDLLLDLAFVFLLAAVAVVFFPAILPERGECRSGPAVHLRQSALFPLA